MRFNRHLTVWDSPSKPREDFTVGFVDAEFLSTVTLRHRLLDKPGVLTSRIEARTGEVKSPRALVWSEHFRLQPSKRPKCLGVALKPPTLGGPLSKSNFAVVAKRRVSQIVSETSRIDHVWIKAQRRANLSSHLGNFQRMGQPIPRKVDPRGGTQDLGFLGELPEPRGVNDSTAVALKVATIRRVLFWDEALPVKASIVNGLAGHH